nr:MAG TPA: hypothetical protein [Caudoviricetes sp.]
MFKLWKTAVSCVQVRCRVFFQGDALCVVLCVETLNPYLLLKVVCVSDDLSFWRCHAGN